MAKKKVLKKSIPKTLMKDPAEMKVNDLVITDEFKTINVNSTGMDAARKLMQIPRGVILVLDDKKDIKGVLTAREFLETIVKGGNPTELQSEKMMNTDIMNVEYDAKLLDVVPEITKRDPYAVTVTDSKGRFKGYFSPKDYQEALARLKSE